MRFLPLVASLALSLVGLGAAPPAKPPTKAAPAKVAAAPGGQVKGDPYSVTVPVDATAAAASVAQNNAINGGRARAWATLSHRLVPQKDWGKLPRLDTGGLERLIRGYTVADEKRSTTRYIARVTYVFNPGAVKHVLRTANIGISDQPGTAVLLVAMAPTYNAHSAWAQALAVLKYAGAQFPLVTPVGDSVDQSTLGPLRFGDAGWGQVQPSASRVHAGAAVLIQASSPAASKMRIRMRQIGPGKPLVLPDVEIPVAAGTPPEKAYAAAAEQAEAAIEEALKSPATVDMSKKSRLVAEVRVASLEQWASLLNRISTISSVSDVDVIALNTGEARVSLSYVGTPDQLRTAAAQSDLTVADRGGSWWISPGKPPEAGGGDE